MRSHYLYLLPLLATIFFFYQQSPDPGQDPSPTFQIPEGFELEDLYCPSCHEQGSWVSMAEDDRGRIYVSDQNGSLYHFDIPMAGDTLDSLDVRPLDLDIGHAHGLLWAFNSLYVAVNRKDSTGIRGSGVYRIKDANGDGELDNIDMLLKLEGRGEHGPHSLALSPDGESLFFIAGNMTEIPESFSSRLPKVNWQEDNLFPAYKDARGHAARVPPPGAWIAEFDPEGENWELFGSGFRNPFDIAFNEDGELFTFDSDMEWDLGMPWYRPTRVCHVTSGANFGWRSGSGKWPDYYPDNLPPIVGLRQGSPTGVLMGTDLQFPARYRDGLFVLDWSFGTIYFVDLKASNSTYEGTATEFLTGTPLPLTDAVAGSDGSMYFMTGGRRLESHLYRLTYTGSESTEKPQRVTDNFNETARRGLRRTLEAYHGIKSQVAADSAFGHLKHFDRFTRYAAQVALQHQDLATWQDLLWEEEDPIRKIQASIALAKHEQAFDADQPKALEILHTIDWNGLTTDQQLDLLRAYQLLCIRLGAPEADQRQQLIDRLRPHFPTDDTRLNRELSQLLVFLEDPEATAQSLQLLEKHAADTVLANSNYLSTDVAARSEQYGPDIQGVLDSMPPTESIYYAVLLSRTDKGWSKDLRERYYDWFYEAFNRKGGVSYKGFLDNIRMAALGKVPEEERAYFKERSGIYSPTMAMADIPLPEGPGQDWTIPKIYDLFNPDSTDYVGQISKGKVVYQTAMCVTCHRSEGEGGLTGPDLTQLHTRFSRNDLIVSLVNPSETISDQYAFSRFEMKDGSMRSGGIVDEDEDSYTIIVNPFDISFTMELKKEDVQSVELSPVSAMPPGLLDRLNGEEVADLFAYLLDREEEE